MSVKHLLQTNHETRARKRRHIKRAISIYRSLLDADLLDLLDEPDEDGRTIRVNLDLQDDFALHQPLSLWALEAIDELDPDDPGYALSVLTTIESVLESPGVIIAAQVNHAKSELMADMKASGVEYEERMERLAEVEPPKPEAERLYESFDRFRVHHPWTGGDNVKPKSIVRDMLEQAMTFREFVNHYGLKRSEGVVLRYLSDTYKALIQNVPEDSKTEELDDIVEWIGAVVRQVDSSLIDEWEQLTARAEGAEFDPASEIVGFGVDVDDVTSNRRAFSVMVRNEMFRWVQALARRRYDLIPGVDVDEMIETMAPYWAEFDEILIDAEARNRHRFVYDHESGSAIQIIHDPDGDDAWRIEATVDLEASAEAANAIIDLERIRSLED